MTSQQLSDLWCEITTVTLVLATAIAIPAAITEGRSLLPFKALIWKIKKVGRKQ